MAALACLITQVGNAYYTLMVSAGCAVLKGDLIL